MLGKVHILILRCCEKVTDVSALGNVYILDLEGTEVADVPLLGNIRACNLDEIRIIDRSVFYDI